MDKIVSTKYKASDGKYFDDPDSCLYYEHLLSETAEATRNVLRWPDVELELIIKYLREAKASAFHGDIKDSFATPQIRAIFYMRQVCEKFVDKYKHIKSL